MRTVFSAPSRGAALYAANMGLASGAVLGQGQGGGISYASQAVLLTVLPAAATGSSGSGLRVQLSGPSGGLASSTAAPTSLPLLLQASAWDTAAITAAAGADLGPGLGLGLGLGQGGAMDGDGVRGTGAQASSFPGVGGRIRFAWTCQVLTMAAYGRDCFFGARYALPAQSQASALGAAAVSIPAAGLQAAWAAGTRSFLVVVTATAPSGGTGSASLRVTLSPGGAARVSLAGVQTGSRSGAVTGLGPELGTGPGSGLTGNGAGAGETAVRVNAMDAVTVLASVLPSVDLLGLNASWMMQPFPFAYEPLSFAYAPYTIDNSSSGISDSSSSGGAYSAAADLLYLRSVALSDPWAQVPPSPSTGRYNTPLVLALAPFALQGSRYTLTLTLSAAMSGSGRSSAASVDSITILVNAAPRGGVVTATLMSKLNPGPGPGPGAAVVALVDSLRLDTLLWTDDEGDLPLRFSFGYQVTPTPTPSPNPDPYPNSNPLTLTFVNQAGSASEEVSPLCPPSPLPFALDVVLPPGSPPLYLLLCRATAIDALGAAGVSPPLTLTAQPPPFSTPPSAWPFPAGGPYPTYFAANASLAQVLQPYP